MLGPRLPRLVYNFWARFYEKSDEKWPIVIDGDELLKDPKGVVDRFCERTGIDEAEVAYEWDTMSDVCFNALPFSTQCFIGKAHKSTGILKEEASLKEPIIDDEQKRWAESYGEDVALRMRKFVDEDMEDYEYLRSKRL